jgi:tetratricopeptide (TPR) repeat protein
MAYVRKRGSQLALVHGERDSATGKVEQRVLFTLYSQAEAREALGLESKEGEAQFRAHLEDSFPSIRFDWKRIRSQIEQHLSVLPEDYAYQEERLDGRFRQDLLTFARQLLRADPQSSSAAGGLLARHRAELEILADIIRWRLDIPPTPETAWSRDNRFYWRYAMKHNEPPQDIEEVFSGLYEKGDTARAQAGFELLVDCFEEYGEGYNYLGLLALERGDAEAAIDLLQKAMAIGRKTFPRRIARKRYWTDLDTRTYVRALRNLVYALNMTGRHDEALKFCSRLEEECGDNATAASHRAAIFLNTGRWQEALEQASGICEVWPQESFIVAFAAFELELEEMAIAHFLHGALNQPRVARILVGERCRKPQGLDETRDHNDGVAMRRSLSAYLGKRSQRRTRFFRGLLETTQVQAMLDEIHHVRQRHARQHAQGQREAFDRIQEMGTMEYANARAREIAPKFLLAGW